MQHEIRHVVAPDGVRIHYEVEGNGEALVLQHGFTADILIWYRFGYVDALKDKYRLILIDARGHGLSDKPHDVEAHTIEKRADDTIAVLDRSRIRQAHIWGYSVGGRVALELGRSHPGRVQTLVIGGMTGEAPRGSQKDRLERRAQHLEASSLASTVAATIPESGPQAPEEEARERISPNDRRALAASMRAVLLWRGVEEDLPLMRTPILMYCGDADHLHVRARENVRALPNAQFVLLPGLNHRQAFRRSDLVLPHVLPFLKRHQSFAT